MERVEISPELYAEIARSLRGDPRGRFRVGALICLARQGSDEELHVHISTVQTVPEEGGRGMLGITVLPFDVRWNRLWSIAQKELPMLRAWLWNLMSTVSTEVDEEQFLAAQIEDIPVPKKLRR